MNYKDTNNLNSHTQTQKTPQSKMCYDFHYPTHSTGWHWEFPWNLVGGLKSWFYKKWQSEVKNKRFWSGIIILGFKKISITWYCLPEQALIEHRKGQEKLFKYLMELSKEPIEDNEETRLFK